VSFDRIEFDRSKAAQAHQLAQDKNLSQLAHEFVVESDRNGYAYQWTWCDLPILQLPQDVLATQDIIFRCRPTVIIETGVAWGGGVALYATLMDLYGGRKIIGIDLNLADEVVNSINRICFKTEIELIRGSSTEPDIVSRVHALLTPDDRVMVLMDSDHSHEHVLRELRTYGPLVSKGQYAIVSDTVVENIPEQTHRPRPWGRGDNPMTAARQYLSETSDFEVDTDIDERLVMSYSPSGYLRKVR
jgi:cephalosporin hydroxylase